MDEFQKDLARVVEIVQRDYYSSPESLQGLPEPLKIA